jgi:hypothetical protein
MGVVSLSFLMAAMIRLSRPRHIRTLTSADTGYRILYCQLKERIDVPGLNRMTRFAAPPH